ncbi:MAG: hypothetical protein HQL26_04400 [Candidatus Omnitrophica bacterium]|nr:hypothetical protein [Candidatus Omnitrophota bacterium]
MTNNKKIILPKNKTTNRIIITKHKQKKPNFNFNQIIYFLKPNHFLYANAFTIRFSPTAFSRLLGYSVTLSLSFMSRRCSFADNFISYEFWNNIVKLWFHRICRASL